MSPDLPGWAAHDKTQVLPAFLTGGTAEPPAPPPAAAAERAPAVKPVTPHDDPDKLPTSERNMLIFVALLLAIGTLAVVAVYALLNALYLYALPIGELAAVPGGRLMDTAAERLFGFAAGHLLALFTIVSLSASISAMILAGPRVYFAMARDGMFVRAAGRVHPRFHTPAAAIIAQSVWSSVLVLSGTLSQLVSYTGFAVVLFSAVAVTALFVLRRRDKHDGRAFSAIGYPWAPALFVAASVVMLANEVWRNPVPTLIGSALILAGVPVYFLMRARN